MMKTFLLNGKSTIKMLLKLLVAAAILYWLVSQNKLDYRLVLLSFKNPVTWIACFLLMSLQIFLAALRWRMILESQAKDIPVWEIVRIQWIGQFFSAVLPGAVTGDLVKVGYVSSLKKNIPKRFLILSIFIDRLAGLNSLLLLAGGSSLIFYRDLVALNPLLKNIIFINLVLFLGSCGLMVVFFLHKSIQEKIKAIIPSEKIRELLEIFWSLSAHKKLMAKVLGISLFTQMMAIVSFWLINKPFFEIDIKLEYLLSLVPLGQVAVAIPISPSGLGVGHAAFDRLFHFIGHSNGASLFNVYWVVMFSANLFGVIPFLFSKGDASEGGRLGDDGL